MILLSTLNIIFGWEIRKLFLGYALLTKGLDNDAGDVCKQGKQSKLKLSFQRKEIPPTLQTIVWRSSFK